MSGSESKPGVTGAKEFEAFVRDSAGRTMAVIRRILKDETESEDALQEAYLAAWRARESFDGRSSMNTWIHRIATNTALNKLRQRKTMRAQLETGGDVEEAGDARGLHSGEIGHAEKYALRDLVWPVIDRLPEDQRVVLVLRDVEGMTSEEVAEKLSISADAVRQRLHRARKLVAETLEPELCGAGDMTCGGRLDLLLDLIDGMLAAEWEKPVKEHVTGCATCQRYRDGYQRMKGLPGETKEVEAEVREVVIRQVLEEVGHR